MMIRPLALAGILLVALSAVAAPVAAADCSLVATAIPGQSIGVAGAAFPAGADITFVVIRNGVSEESQALRSDGAGQFATSVDAGPGRGGAYTLIATAGTCKAVADVVAVETAGGAGVAGRPTQPATDTLATTPAIHTGDGFPLGSVVLVGVAIGGGLFAGVRRLALRGRRRAADSPARDAPRVV
jgi:hypothetical protein